MIKNKNQNEALLSFFYDHSNRPIAFLDKQGAILDCNNEFKNILNEMNKLGSKSINELFRLKTTSIENSSGADYKLSKIKLYTTETDVNVKTYCGRLIQHSDFEIIILNQNDSNNELIAQISEINLDLAGLSRELSKKNNELRITKTNLENAQNELIDINHNLEEKVKERTQQLLNAKNEAVESALVAKKALEIKTRFMANMSHELKTPLNGIIGLNYLITRTDLNDKQKEYFAQLEYSANELLRLINNLLEFSSIEAGSRHESIHEFSLDSVIDTLENSLINKMDNKPIKVKFNVDKTLPKKLLGYPRKIEQVLYNLAENAIKYTDKGSVNVDVVSLKDNKDSVVAKFSVKDTGIGIEKNKQSKILLPFTQADISSTRNYGGVGLGVTISRMLVELMGGELKVNSKVNAGSEFYFVLTIKKCGLDNRYNNE